jgi:hypothetical protein
MNSDKINWAVIEHRLEKLNKDQTWLALQLGIGKSAVANWKIRGEAPASNATALANHLQVTIDELLGPDGEVEPSKRGHKKPLSDEAQELIRCVTRLDAIGDLARKTIVLHAGLLRIASELMPFGCGARADRTRAAFDVPRGKFRD